MENFVGAKFCCPHTIADGNQRSQDWEEDARDVIGVT